MSKYFNEIKQGGIKGIFGLDQMDWGGDAGYFFEIWRLKPCCGSPDAAGCISCVLHWHLLGWLTFMRTFAWSQDTECGIIPHCVPFLCFCGPCVRLAFRYNLRNKAGVSGNLIGDFVCVTCCNLCACLQELRSMPKNAWQMFPTPPIKAPKIMLCV